MALASPCARTKCVNYAVEKAAICCAPIAEDTDYLVRRYVARRLPPGRLFRMMLDPDREVRKTVAQRLPEESLMMMRRDSDSEAQVSVRAVTACNLERLAWTPGLSGADLANRLHTYDHEAGYPMARFSHMVASTGVSHRIGLQVANDHQQGFSYLPEPDLNLLRRWVAAPYRA